MIKPEDLDRFTKSRRSLGKDENGNPIRRVHIRAHSPCPIEATFEDKKILSMAGKYAAMSTARVYSLVRAAQYVVKHDIPGVAVVCGVGLGGSALALARAFRNAGETDREIWLYDTFDSEKRPELDDYRSPIDYVKTILKKRCPEYNQDAFVFVKGMVEDTIPGKMPAVISILHADTDWYDSTKHELKHLYPRITRGGVILIDDYGVWEGARRATDEYFEELSEPILLHAVDHTGRMGVKTTGAEK